MKNAEIKALMRFNGEVARYLKMPLKDLTRRLNSKEASPQFRRHLLKAIEGISKRPEDFYDEYS